jgi:CRISPR-associated protein Csb2
MVGEEMQRVPVGHGFFGGASLPGGSAPERLALRRRLPRAPVHGALIALEGPRLPRITDALPVAEIVRIKLMGLHRGIVGSPAAVSPRFSGKDARGRPLRGHRHCRIMPRDEDHDGCIDHLMVVAGEPLGWDECQAIAGLSRFRETPAEPFIQCLPLRWGTPEELFPPARVFTSLTPFVLPRFYRRGRGSFPAWVAAELHREAANLGLGGLEILARPPGYRIHGALIPWTDFARARKGERPRPAYGFTIRFPEPVSGPLAMGYASHFGMGQFVPLHSPEGVRQEHDDEQRS